MEANSAHVLFETQYILHIVLKFFPLEEGCKLRRVNQALNSVVRQRPDVHIVLDPNLRLEEAKQYLNKTAQCYTRFYLLRNKMQIYMLTCSTGAGISLLVVLRSSLTKI
jgi:hypothetical protein